MTKTSPAPLRHADVAAWVEQLAAHLRPDRVVWINGSAGERAALTEQAVREGVLIPLDQRKRPGCYYHRSHPSDVARVEERTFICTPTADEAGPTNRWCDPVEMERRLMDLLAGSYVGRTLYVVPYLMGQPGGVHSQVGVELTDSLYVVLSMGVMTRMGDAALRELAQQQAAGRGVNFNRGIHGTLDLDPKHRYIAHFPQKNQLISTSSNYGGNVLLGKKCLGLRIASYLGRQQGWLAEHMLILRVTDPQGRSSHVAAAFPSACGKTNFAMLVPPQRFRGWTVQTIGDDIAWMWVDDAGRLRAMNPENGYFGVAPGTSRRTNPNAVETIGHDTIFTNTALTYDGDVWWEGADDPPPHECRDWRGEHWSDHSLTKAAHPNSRFASPLINNPVLAPEAFDAQGVVIDALVFGGRRATTYPLVFESFDWEHGVYLGATLGSEMTAAADGGLGQVRRDPMAMLPFCGYHMGDYFAHWLATGARLKTPPRIFTVNWFRKDAAGALLWPGFGENMRVLQWIVERTRGCGAADQTALGWMPTLEAIDLQGLQGFSRARLAEALAIRPEEWHGELASQDGFFAQLGDRLPSALRAQHAALRQRLE